MRWTVIRGRRSLVFGGLVAALALAAVALAVPNTLTTVRATSAYETLPAHNAAANILLWDQRPSAGSPASSTNVMASIGNGPAFRVNAAGTSGRTGDVSDGGLAVYQQNSDLRFQNLVTHVVPPVPAGINTAGVEMHPSMVAVRTSSSPVRITSGWLLFGRDNGTNQRVILFNLATGASRVLETGAHITPGQINGENGEFWADWQSCALTCDIHAYAFTPATWNTGTKRSLNISEDHTASGPGVSDEGVVTYIQGQTACGSSVELNKIRFQNMGTGTPITLVDFPSGFDSFSTYVDKTERVYIDRHACGGDSNLYRTSLALQTP